jgi:hypothetical protein
MAHKWNLNQRPCKSNSETFRIKCYPLARRSRVYSRWGHWIFNWPNSSSRTMDLGLSHPLTETNTRNFPGGKGRPTCKPDLIDICEHITYKMWKSRCLTTLRASTDWNRNSFIFFLFFLISRDIYSLLFLSTPQILCFLFAYVRNISYMRKCCVIVKKSISQFRQMYVSQHPWIQKSGRSMYEKAL